MTDPATATTITKDAPAVVDGDASKTDAEPTAAAATDAAAPAETTEAAEKAVEPITEGQLAYKGPGLLKSIIPSKKEFWLSDDAVAPQHLDLYLRGEKPEISHPVVAWASQTGKGLLFFNKKGETNREHPSDVLALYDASDLKKSAQHEFSFKLHADNHTFKAANDAERDGWYLSIERAIEHAKASKDEIRASEGYKAEIEKLNKPNVVGAATTRSLSKPKKSTDVPPTERIGSSDGEADEDKKKAQKSRSTSRGILNRFKSNREESAEKKAEQEDKKEEVKATEEAPVAASTEAAPVVASTSAAEIPAAADVAAEEKAAETPVEEKAKAGKRGSIFGRVSSGWSGLRSPAKEKDIKDAELKNESATAAPVSENPPVLPETAAASDSTPVSAVPAVEEPATEAKTEEKKEEVASPSKEKNNFLAGIGGFIKRNRSVSPNTHKKEAAEAAAAEPAATEPAVKAEEPATEATATAAEPSTEAPVEKTEEPKTETTTPNKRQSVLGSLGRRASKALNRIQAPKKDNTVPAAADAKAEDTAAVKPAEETPAVNGETKKEEPEAQKSIGDVVPDAVNVGQPQQQNSPAVTASA
ncbi:hypothetical protein CERZMDRAFT_43352 [Cercospora zeae-maydis SCOH1-5]|uniref:PH domain-containing protein n=1 Tax=Cercospora zeae-maydis SCOH1-5 TaxID=717836 RepID=A0A6A6FD77_9PEZI|nr:hypothetical protein CERZMDRAFT_43352 [Cercospora zeae-maydis SCOH1-5]